MDGREKQRATRSGRERPGSTAWAALREEFYPQIRSWFVARVANAQDADDLTQDVFAQLADGDLSDDPKAYIAGVASRVLSRHRRRQARERAFLRRLVAQTMGATNEHGARASEDEESVGRYQKFANDVLRGLTHAQAELLKLRFMERLPVVQVARRIGCSPAAAYKRIQRLLQQVRERYGVEPNRPGDADPTQKLHCT